MSLKTQAIVNSVSDLVDHFLQSCGHGRNDSQGSGGALSSRETDWFAGASACCKLLSFRMNSAVSFGGDYV